MKKTNWKNILTRINTASILIFLNTQALCVIITLMLGNHNYKYITNDGHHMIEGWLIFFCWISLAMLLIMVGIKVARKCFNINTNYKIFSL
jgi:hypothetical protein